MNQNRSFLLLICVLLAAFFLRMFNLYDHTEFLGDQGREGIVVFNAWHSSTIPLIGPPVSTGQYLGPVFYYIIAPFFIATNFNPMGPIILMVLFDIGTLILLYKLISKLCNKHIALLTTLLYALSPEIIQKSRTLWNPTPIPFFMTLLMFSLYEAIINKKYTWFLWGAVSTGILVQLHYSTIIVIPLIICGLLYSYLTDKKNRSQLTTHSALSVLIVIGLTVPFLIYESQHNWLNIQSLLSLASGKSGLGLRSNIQDAIQTIRHAINFLMPIENAPVAVGIFIGLVVSPIITKYKWSMIVAGVLVLCVGFIALSVDNPAEHYTRFLIPLLFILLASVLTKLTLLNKYLPAVAAIVIVAFLYIPEYSLIAPNKYDLSRTEETVDTMITKAHNKTFSFTLISSRSFSDLHYRFYFLTKGTTPTSIESQDFDTLYLVCEKDPCPTELEMRKTESVQAMCFDPLCSREYPRISLTNWQLQSVDKLTRSTVYRFTH